MVTSLDLITHKRKSARLEEFIDGDKVLIQKGMFHLGWNCNRLPVRATFLPLHRISAPRRTVRLKLHSATTEVSTLRSLETP
ncbi:hypothetical protein E2C01_024271 [Portunus trituberculatus]|uniref:Uncharacterized protein n=1 Tax=Portunus trituberculatus TaxID=210409 RepID=A0A5B7E9W3_PORTR|nr:hypothetical protein [Portunus trituberculatus]